MFPTTTTQASAAMFNPPFSFTCNTCEVTFNNSETQRAHMRNEWHVYNLKRRIASLSPISSDVFQEQVLVACARSKLAETDASVERLCAICQETYDGRKAYQSHLKSQEHALKAANSTSVDLNDGEDKAAQRSGAFLLNESDVPSPTGVGDDMITDVSFIVSQCLFCNSDSSTLELNLVHMHKQHGLFIPNQEYLYDIESLLGYLFKVISDFHACIYCETTKATVEGIQQHMIDKGHCTINLDEDSEMEEFYDFPTSDSETERAEAVTGDNGDQNSDRLTQGSSTASEHDLLRLPSGKTLGHRSQSRYYRQHLPSPAERAERAAERKAITDSSSSENNDPHTRGGRQIATRANGGTGMIGVPEQQQRALRAVEKKMMKQEVRTRNEYQWAVQKNSNQQKHFNPR